MCSKLRWTSRSAAILGSRNCGHRLRAYFCPECRSWHVTKAHANVTLNPSLRR